MEVPRLDDQLLNDISAIKTTMAVNEIRIVNLEEYVKATKDTQRTITRTVIAGVVVAILGAGSNAYFSSNAEEIAAQVELKIRGRGD